MLADAVRAGLCAVGRDVATADYLVALTGGAGSGLVQRLPEK